MLNENGKPVRTGAEMKALDSSAPLTKTGIRHIDQEELGIDKSVDALTQRVELLDQEFRASQDFRRANESELQASSRRITELEETLAIAEAQLRGLSADMAIIKSSFLFRFAASFRSMGRLWRRSPVWVAKAMLDLHRSGLFDSAFYRATQPDVRASGIQPLLHFLLHGGAEGRRPSPLFDCRYYLSENPDVRNAGGNPLLHYIRFGRKEGRPPQAPRLNDATLTPLDREISNLSQSGLLECGWYLEQYPDVKKDGMDPVEHYVRHGWREGRDPAPWFDTNYYLQSYLSAQHEGVNPLLHYLDEGYRRGLLPRGSRAPVSGRFGALPLNEWGTRGDPDGARSARHELPEGGSILFIGCDALLAGSQVLLLTLVRWLHAHTSLRLHILLPTGGPLLAHYRECANVLVWHDFVQQVPDRYARADRLREHFGKIDLVYGNTIVAPTLYEELAFLGAPFLSHIHELDQSIRLYGDPKAIRAMQRRTTTFIGCSPPVSANLVTNYNASPQQVHTIHAFIPDRLPESRSRAALRDELGLPAKRFLIVGCGTMYWRKGVDLFVETAIRLDRLLPGKCHFVWIGSLFWDLDPRSRSLMPWQAILDRISEHGLEAAIEFVGVKENAQDYFAAADVFYLPSREDPFPLVCLEAAQVGTPVICFEGAGGIPELVGQDAGVVVCNEDVECAAAALAKLVRDEALRQKLGAAAAEKVRNLYTDNIAVPQILALCHQTMGRPPLVSVIVPVYNHERFLAQRLESILAQSFRDIEILILDDASSDGSVSVARRFESHPLVRVIVNENNSGSAFRQWRKGIGLARGEFVWIAEGDDSSSPDFLHELLPFFNDSDVALAYSDSVMIDVDGNPMGGYAAYYDSLDSGHWKMDYVVPAETEISLGLGVKNTIPNVSAVLFRKHLATDDILENIESMRFSGDWLFYVHLLMGKKIAFRSQPLNLHRKHAETLTHRFNQTSAGAKSLLDEASRVHEFVLANYRPGRSYPSRLASYLGAQIEGLFGKVSPAEFDKYYPVKSVLSAAEAAVAKNPNPGLRVAFITTGDAAHDGGSEQLWIQTAMRLADSDAHVLVVIKRWSPEPYFFANFRDRGIEFAFKDDDAKGALVRFRPALVVINIGDQDEGSPWYTLCRDKGLPYVIVNHLTKEPQVWPIRHDLVNEVRAGNLYAQQVFFTSRNNRLLQEKRLGCAIRHADLFHNPLFIDRSRSLPFPDLSGPLRLAMPSRMLNIHKGQNIALQVFAMEKWKARDVELHLYGSGPDEEQLKTFASRNRLSRVFFHNPNWQLPSPEMETIWKHCHGLLMTSFMEGMPIVLLNAMFYGRVPIVTDVGGHSEVINDGMNGFIARQPTPEAVDAALERAWACRLQWAEIGRQARERMLQFSPEDPVGEMIDKLKFLVRTPPTKTLDIT